MTIEKKEKTIAFKVSSEDHMRIKLAATKQGKSLKQYILDLIMLDVNKDK